jgi:hypothetical protein
MSADAETKRLINQLRELYPTISSLVENFNDVVDNDLAKHIFSLLEDQPIQWFIEPEKHITHLDDINLPMFIKKLNYLQYDFKKIKKQIWEHVFNTLTEDQEYALMDLWGYAPHSRRYVDYMYQHKTFLEIDSINKRYKSESNDNIGLFYDVFTHEAIVNPKYPIGCSLINSLNQRSILSGSTKCVGEPQREVPLRIDDPFGTSRRENEVMVGSEKWGDLHPPNLTGRMYPYIQDPQTNMYVRAFNWVDTFHQYTPRQVCVNENFYTSREMFDRMFGKYTGFLFSDDDDSFNWNHIVISGGFILEMVKRTPVLSNIVNADIDMFIYGTGDEIRNKVEYLLNRFRRGFTFLTYHIDMNLIKLSLRCNRTGVLYKIEIIGCGSCRTRFEIFKNYDLDYNVIGFDGTDVFASSDSWYTHTSMVTRTLKFNMKRNRLVKAVYKGYEVAFTMPVYYYSTMSIDNMSYTRTIKGTQIVEVVNVNSDMEFILKQFKVSYKSNYKDDVGVIEMKDSIILNKLRPEQIATCAFEGACDEDPTPIDEMMDKIKKIVIDMCRQIICFDPRSFIHQHERQGFNKFLNELLTQGSDALKISMGRHRGNITLREALVSYKQTIYSLARFLPFVRLELRNNYINIETNPYTTRGSFDHGSLERGKCIVILNDNGDIIPVNPHNIATFASTYYIDEIPYYQNTLYDYFIYYVDGFDPEMFLDIEYLSKIYNGFKSPRSFNIRSIMF